MKSMLLRAVLLPVATWTQPMPSVDALLEAGGAVASSAHGEASLHCTLVEHLLADS